MSYYRNGANGLLFGSNMIIIGFVNRIRRVNPLGRELDTVGI